MKQTQNYQLNQWELTDRIQMEDFNSDNEKTDAALQGLVQQIASERAEVDATLQGLAGQIATKADQSALTAGLATKGNCRIEQRTYVGTGTYGKDAPNSMTFAEKPLLMVLLGGTLHMVLHGSTNGSMLIESSAFYAGWSGNTFSWYSDTASTQFNYSGATYTMLAFYAA